MELGADFHTHQQHLYQQNKGMGLGRPHSAFTPLIPRRASCCNFMPVPQNEKCGMCPAEASISLAAVARPQPLIQPLSHLFQHQHSVPNFANLPSVGMRDRLQHEERSHSRLLEVPGNPAAAHHLHYSPLAHPQMLTRARTHMNFTDQLPHSTPHQRLLFNQQTTITGIGGCECCIHSTRSLLDDMLAFQNTAGYLNQQQYACQYGSGAGLGSSHLQGCLHCTNTANSSPVQFHNHPQQYFHSMGGLNLAEDAQYYVRAVEESRKSISSMGSGNRLHGTHRG